MDAQLLMPLPPLHCGFDSTSTSPYATAPSSPKMFFASSSRSIHRLSPNHPHNKVHHRNKDDDDMDFDLDFDFEFEFSGQLERPSISAADELFDGGKIKPLDAPQPRLQSSNDSSISSPRSYKKKHVGTFQQTPTDQTRNPSQRGRERTTRQKARSLSPLRVLPAEENNPKVLTNQSFPYGFMWYNKWNLKNLLLFRSTSEGSAARSNEVPLKKYAMITKGEQNDSVGGSSRRMKRKMSAHEMHYTANRAVAEEMRRKTFLPYKSGLLGCLGFHRDVHEISRGRRV